MTTTIFLIFHYQILHIYLLKKSQVFYVPIYSNTYNLLHINCRSLPKNFDSLCSTIDCINIPFTAIAVTETWLKEHNKDIYAIPGYAFLSNSRLHKIGSGVGLYINNQLHYKQLADIIFVTETIECLFVEILIQGKKI